LNAEFAAHRDPQRLGERQPGCSLGWLGPVCWVEIRCPNVDTWHILVSHLGVAMLCALAGIVIGLAIERKNYVVGPILMKKREPAAELESTAGA
jgi:hypothetical protein